MTNSNRNRAQGIRRAADAKSLGAIDVHELISTIPSLKKVLSPADIVQFQKVLNAAVLNPAYQDAYKKALSSAVQAQAGNLILYDEGKKHKAEQILRKQLRVLDHDHYVRVDYYKMLSPRALEPRTNNPDKAAYLTQVRKVLDIHGVWLHLKQPWEHRKNPKVWSFSFTLGRNGPKISTSDAVIDREELLSTSMLGQGYEKAVLTGPFQTTLKRMMTELDTQLLNARTAHLDLRYIRETAGAGVAQTSEFFGDTSLPGTDIWLRAETLKKKAHKMNAAGDVLTARAHLLGAAKEVETNAELLAAYARNVDKGAGKALKILGIAEKAGKIVDAILILMGAGAAAIGVRAAVKAAAKSSAQKALTAKTVKALPGKTTDDLAEAFYQSELKKRSGLSDAEIRSVELLPGPKGTKLGSGRNPGQSSGSGTGWESWP